MAQRGEKARIAVCSDANIGFSTLDQLIRDVYPRVPSSALRERLCKALGVTEEELFPPVKGKAS